MYSKQQKREAIERKYVNMNTTEKPMWESSTDILKWLKAF